MRICALAGHAGCLTTVTMLTLDPQARTGYGVRLHVGSDAEGYRLM